MKTIGEILKSQRIKKKLSVEKIEEETKIKKEFIKALEEGRWESLPEFAVVLGFAKNLSSYLGIKEEKAAALLKRDYPPKKKEPIAPQRDVGREFIWSPKLTFFLGALFLIFLFSAYLGFEYLKFVSPPNLTIDEPKEGQIFSKNKAVIVKGQTDPNATVKINNQPVLLEENGQFSAEIEVLEGDQELTIISKSRAKKETIIKRKIIVEEEK